MAKLRTEHEANGVRRGRPFKHLAVDAAMTAKELSPKIGGLRCMSSEKEMK